MSTKLAYVMSDVMVRDIHLKGIDLLVKKDTAQDDLKGAFDSYSRAISNNCVGITRDRDYHVSYDFSKDGNSWRSFIGWRSDFDQNMDGFVDFLIPKGKYRRFVFGPTENPEADTKEMFETAYQNIGSLQCELFQYIFYRPNTSGADASSPITSVFAEIYVMLAKG